MKSYPVQQAGLVRGFSGVGWVVYKEEEGIGQNF